MEYSVWLHVCEFQHQSRLDHAGLCYCITPRVTEWYIPQDYDEREEDIDALMSEYNLGAHRHMSSALSTVSTHISVAVLIT